MDGGSEGPGRVFGGTSGSDVIDIASSDIGNRRRAAAVVEAVTSTAIFR